MTASSSDTAIPVVTTVSPATGSTTGGIIVIITGAGFTGATGVNFGGASAAAVTVDSDTQITATSPAGAGTVDVTVTTSAGTSATGPADQFTYTPAALALTGVSPAAGSAAGGITVILTGAGFTGATNVSFGGASAAAVTVDSDTQITATSPAGAGTVDVTVTTAAGASAASPAGQFSYTPTPAAPVLAGIFPDAGIAAGGTTVILTGAGFTGATNVSFGGASAAAVTVDSDTQITAISPAGAGTVDVTVTTAAGASAASPAGQFSYTPTPAAPVLAGIFPGSGTAAGGTTVTLIGLHFTGATDVRFGAASAAMTVDSDTQITATSPPGAGAVYPAVTTPGGTTHLAGRFTYIVSGPQVTGISPASGTAAGGITVTITGSGFAGATDVRFGAASAAMTVDSGSQITATSPPGAGAVGITVTSPAGASAAGGLAAQFTYTTPVVTGVSPANGGAVGGTAVTITGSGFAGATGVAFGHVYAAAMTVDSDSQITATSPPGAGAVDITVTSPAGTSLPSPAGRFSFIPAVTGISPAGGSSAGETTVTITGAGFTGATGVSFGGAGAAAMNVDSDTQITATSPPGGGTVDITVITLAGISAPGPAGPFTYTPAALAVTSIFPASGDAAGGTTVTITGAGFTGATGVSFGGAGAAAMTVDSDAQITATSPPGAGTVDVAVTTPAGTSATSSADLFTYTPAAVGPPQITRVVPASGDPLGGTLVTVSGSGLSPITSVLFGAQPGTGLTVVSDAELTVLSPPGAGAVDVRVVSAGGTATATAAFSYDAAVTVYVVRPDDHLLLQFEFSNGAVDPGPPLQVIPLDEAQPLLAVVSFPPLHIAEADLAIPAPGALPPAPVGPVPAAMSGPSRLVFKVPPGVPLRLDALLDWSQWALIPPAARQAEPQPLESALELPYRVIVSTGGTTQWQHSIPAAVLGGISELWHTDLDLTGGPQPLSIPWSPDLSITSGSAVACQPPAPVRAALAQAGQATIRRLTLSGLGAWTDFQLGQDIQGGAVPAPSSNLAFWHQVTGGGRNQLVKVEGTPGYLYAFGFRALLITITERQVLVASDGTATETLCTTQSMAVTKAEVDFSNPTAAGLPYGGRGLPFTRIRLVTTTVPVLNPQLTPGTPPVIPTVKDPVSNQNVPVQFHMVATDLAGRDLDLVQPLLFVPDPGQTVDYLGAGVPSAVLVGDPVTYLPPPAPGSATLPTSAMSFTLQPAQQSGLGAPFVPTMTGAVVNVPAVGQLLKSAGADALTPPGGRIPGQATIAFHPAYLTSGLGGASNAGQIFAQFVPGLDGLTDPLQPPPSVLPLSIPADRAGGLASPNLPFDGLSSSLGPVAGSNDLVTGSLSDVFAKLSDVNLLGLINLSDVFAQIPVGQLSLARLPAIAHQEMPGQLVTTFDWSPPLAGGLIGGLLELLPDTTLTLHSKTVTPVGNPAASTFTLSGTLATFALNFINGDGTVRVQFDHLSFQAQLGQKIDLSTGNGVQISFGGMLAFVNELANLLPAGGFSDPPFLTATADGVSAGYTLAIPSAGVGLLSLENVAITAALDLPFNGAAGMRFAFAERYHTFLATVSLIAGGGYLAVEVDATGVQRVEGALELGANLTVDLVIVSANVHVIAGFYFSYDQGAVSFDGYLRIGGSVSLAGIASISVELVLSLAYNTDTTPANSIVGSASVTVSVSVLMMSTSFTFSASKRFPIPGNGTAVSGAATAALAGAGRLGFADLMTLGDFAAYCGAFA